MSSESSSTEDLLGYYFLKLPRELRDLVYFYLVTDSSPIVVTDVVLQPIIPHPTLAAEVLEATYTYNTFETTISHDAENASRNIWKQQAKYTKYIRHVIINTTEVGINLDACSDGSALERMEYDCTVRRPHIRKPWEDLLELPRLESLVINLQKRESAVFDWANFSPILYELRARLPQLHTTFNVSFDDILRVRWEDESWADPVPYIPMGFIDVSEMIAPPSDDDRKYVEKHLPNMRTTVSRDAVRGLLDESRAQRRSLGQYYVVKEPALLRLRMAEHYQVYKGLITDSVGACQN
ncbi:hypothetical protein P153DRAFT_22269 [Dothidotthia symphoricarpi CBS 119687]|uniref:Uncharacterized protein n=1 Tax=Dothidotthia symphoricarpi CBS 119687 TaxID=1392245 RepID=A0A6A6AGN9_9PLEO|nr:uncharacterized protein P153DRAFT_22269 [Dothidotthia symphoricarpi CBS 119687]KAF2129591.1 hypothetical protein P153DRAFT_22269 [Dothidotthia symphoricarpi CBS 119687]